MKIIVGLGNIGAKYEQSRHNCGFMFIDALIESVKSKNTEIEFKNESKFKAFVTKVTLNDETLLLVKPTTMMNLSGEAVAKILNFYKEPIENLIVIFDDVDLPLGKIRVRDKGSAGTHNGMKSIIASIGSENFKRIRIGIESRGVLTPKQMDISSFVLEGFNKEELLILKDSLAEAIKELKTII